MASGRNALSPGKPGSEQNLTCPLSSHLLRESALSVPVLERWVGLSQEAHGTPIREMGHGTHLLLDSGSYKAQKGCGTDGALLIPPFSPPQLMSLRVILSPDSGLGSSACQV